jgi:hypothetical protein
MHLAQVGCSNRCSNRYRLSTMNKTNDVKENFSGLLRESLKARYGRVPSAAVLAREFNLRAYDTTPVTGESARRWLRGVCLPEEERLRVLVNWLGLNFNDALTHRNGNGKTSTVFNGSAHKLYAESPPPKKPSNGESHEEQDLYKLILALPAPERPLILDLLRIVTQARSSDL